MLTPESVESLAPPAGWSHEMPYILGCPVRVLFGTIATPRGDAKDARYSYCSRPSSS